MKLGKGRLAAYASLGVGLGLFIAAALALKRPLLERWDIRQLRSADHATRREAIRRLSVGGSTRAVPALLSLVSGDEPLGIPAALAVVRLGQAGPQLVEALRATDGAFRKAVVEAMARSSLEPRACLEIYLELGLKDPCREASEAALSGLVGIGREAVPALVRALDDRRVVIREDRDPGDWDQPGSSIRGRALSVLRALGPEAADAVPALVACLREDQEVSWEAGAALAAIGKAAVPDLIVALDDDRSRAAAADAFRRMEGPAKDALPALIEGLQDPDFNVRESCAQALGGIGPEARQAIPALLGALRDPAFYQREVWQWSGRVGPDCSARSLVTQALAKIGAESDAVVPGLVAALEDEHPCLVESAARALGEFGPRAREALPALLRILSTEPQGRTNQFSEPEGNPRPVAAEALAKIGPDSKEALAALKAAVASGEEATREAAAEALGMLETAVPVPVATLVAALAREGDDDVLAKAAEALGKAGPQALPALREALESGNPRLRRGAIQALGEMGWAAREAAPALVKIFEDGPPEVRAPAARALFHMGCGGSVPIPRLIEALKDPNFEIRKFAAIILGGIGPPAAAGVPALMGALKDPQGEVRVHAAHALSAMGPAAAAAVPALLEALRDTSFPARDKRFSPQNAAASSLGKLGKTALPAVLEVLKASDPVVVRMGVRALGHMETARAEVIPPLRALLNKKDQDLLVEVASALQKLGVPQEELPFASPARKPPAKARKPVALDVSSAEHRKALEWFDTLGFPDLKGCRFVRVTPGHWIQRQGRPREWRCEYGFLLGTEGERFTVLGHGARRRTYPGEEEQWIRPGKSVGYDLLDLEKEARDLLENCEFPAISGRWIVEPRRGQCFFDDDSSCDRKALEIFLLAKACERNGLEKLALDLCRYAEAVGFRDRFRRAIQELTLREMLERTLPAVLLRDAVEAYCDRRVPSADALRKLRVICESFPESKARAEEMARELERMTREDQTHPRVGPEALQALPWRERIAELIFQLRDEVGREGMEFFDALENAGGKSSPAKELVRIGPQAVPQLTEALQDASLTRVRAAYIPGSTDGMPRGPLTVGECAHRILERILGRNLYRLAETRSEGPWNARAAVYQAWFRAWHEEFVKKGDLQILLEGLERRDDDSPEQARLLAERHPVEAVGALATAAQKAEKGWMRSYLVSLLAKVPGDAPVPFLLEEAQGGPFQACRLAAAGGLQARKRPEGVQAILKDWSEPRAERPDGDSASGSVSDLLRFLVESAEPRDLRKALPEHWEKRPVGEKVDLIRVLMDLSAPGKGEPGRSPVIEEFLRSLLAEGTHCRLTRGSFSFDDEAMVGRTTRICDLAAHVLSRNWPAKYRFDLEAPLKARDVALLELSKARGSKEE